MSRFHHSVSWNQSSNANLSAKAGDAKYKLKCDALLADESDADSFQLQTARSALRSPQTFFEPLHYEPNYHYPLIVWLHSDGFNENQINHVIPHVSTRNYVATGIRGNRAADSIGHRFDLHDSGAAIDAAHEKILTAIDEAQDRYSIHSGRVVLAGYRAGGTMALRIALRDPERFAGVASLGGEMPNGSCSLGNWDGIREREMPMLWQYALHRNDFDHDALQDDIRQAMLLKAKVEIRQYKTNDEMNTAVLSDFNEWVMTQIVTGQVGSKQWDSATTCFSSN